MNLNRKLAAGLLAAGMITGAGLAAATPAGAATSRVSTPATAAHWIDGGNYPTKSGCQAAGALAVRNTPHISAARCDNKFNLYYNLQLWWTPQS